MAQGKNFYEILGVDQEATQEQIQSAYRKLGFSGYQLDPQLGKALFWEKKL